MTWLAGNDPQADDLLTFYSEAPANMMLAGDPWESPRRESVGAINLAHGEYDFTVTMPVNALHHVDLILLALVFLTDQG